MDQIGNLIERVAVTMGAAVNRAFAEAGLPLTLSQYDALRCLEQRGEVNQLELAQALSKDAAAIKRTIDCLHRNGLVTRTIASMWPRKNAIKLTDKAVALLPLATVIVNSVYAQAFADIDDADKAALKDSLETIFHNLIRSKNGAVNGKRFKDIDLCVI